MDDTQPHIKVVVIMGAIGSGKTTAINMIPRIADDMGLSRSIAIFPENTDEWQYYLKKFYSDRATYGYLLQMEVLLHFHSVTKELEKMKDRGGVPMTVFVERSPLDIIHVFLKANKEHYTEQTYRALTEMSQKYSDSEMWRDASFVMINVPPDQCMSRIRNRDRGGEFNIDDEYVSKIDKYYEDMVHALKSEGRNVSFIDYTPEQTPFDVSCSLIDRRRR